MKIHSALCTLLLASSMWQAAWGNNIQVTNATLTGNTGTNAYVQFDLSWENSWRGGAVTNWDAAWVFVKFRTSALGQWQHANLDGTGHIPAAGSLIDAGLLDPGAAFDAVTNPAVGVFIYRDAAGSGALNLPSTRLNWNFAAQGLNYASIAQVQVFAVEMVQVSTGAFALGSNGAEFDAFIRTTINTPDATVVPSGAGGFGGAAGGYPSGPYDTPTTPGWPNGFSAFYCMKYEVTQQQYVDFLNTLSNTQQAQRTATSIYAAAGTGALTTANAFRNGIDIQTPASSGYVPAVFACNLNGNANFNEPTDGSAIACNFLKWADLAAYLDWSGLRPMTEVEFEKACRGVLPAVLEEFPWGVFALSTGNYTLSNAGAPNEGVATNYSTVSGNASHGAQTDGPLRVGVFAANGGNNGRITSGASYYGIMELGGNVSEMTVNIQSSAGTQYTGKHGDGRLSFHGDMDVPNWPPAAGSTGLGLRGGSWAESASYMMVSDRSFATWLVTARDAVYGGRGVRSAP